MPTRIMLRNFSTPCGQHRMAFLADIYLYTKWLHIVSVIAWMAGLFYLPRLFVYHVEMGGESAHSAQMLATMERRLLKAIMNPAMIATWVFGVLLLATPGIADFGSIWLWTKLAGVVAMTWFHMWLGQRRKDFMSGTNRVSGRGYRLMNEVPTLLMLVIVAMVVIKPF